MTDRLLTDSATSHTSTWIWLGLMALTLVSLALGGSRFAGATVTFAVLAISVLKGQLIAGHFMGLRRVRLRWRILMLMYLAVVGGLIALAYLIGID